MTGVAVFPGPDSVAHEEMHKAGRAATPGCGFDQDGGKSEIDSFCDNPEQRTSLVATSSGAYNDIKYLVNFSMKQDIQTPQTAKLPTGVRA